MIEITLINYLKQELEEPVWMTIPKGETLPDEYVLIQKTGSSRADRLTHSMFAIQSYGRSLYNAMDLNRKVKAAMDEIIALDDVCACRLNSDYNFTDTQAKNYRYQAVYELAHF